MYLRVMQFGVVSLQRVTQVAQSLSTCSRHNIVGLTRLRPLACINDYTATLKWCDIEETLFPIVLQKVPPEKVPSLKPPPQRWPTPPPPPPPPLPSPSRTSHSPSPTTPSACATSLSPYPRPPAPCS